MPRPSSQYRANREPRNDRQAHSEICCTGECDHGRECPAVRHEQPKPARMTWRERIAAWIDRHLVDPIVRD